MGPDLATTLAGGVALDFGPSPAVGELVDAHPVPKPGAEADRLYDLDLTVTGAAGGFTDVRLRAEGDLRWSPGTARVELYNVRLVGRGMRGSQVAVSADLDARWRGSQDVVGASLIAPAARVRDAHFMTPPVRSAWRSLARRMAAASGPISGRPTGDLRMRSPRTAALNWCSRVRYTHPDVARHGAALESHGSASRDGAARSGGLQWGARLDDSLLRLRLTAPRTARVSSWGWTGSTWAVTSHPTTSRRTVWHPHPPSWRPCNGCRGASAVDGPANAQRWPARRRGGSAVSQRQYRPARGGGGLDLAPVSARAFSGELAAGLCFSFAACP